MVVPPPQAFGWAVYTPLSSRHPFLDSSGKYTSSTCSMGRGWTALLSGMRMFLCRRKTPSVELSAILAHADPIPAPLLVRCDGSAA